VYEVRPQSILEQRVGFLAVALAIEPDFDPTSAGDALAEAADGNPTALKRALGRVLSGPSGGSGTISRRAALALRIGLDTLAARAQTSGGVALDGAGRTRG
jgi:hypothetical protein